jgi:copper resistance protein B
MNKMKIWGILLFLIFLPVTGMAADKLFTDPEQREFPADYHKMDTAPRAGEGIRKYAEDAQSGAQENFGLQPVHDNEPFAVFLGDRLEYQSREGEGAMLWDVQAWIGSDYNKLWFKSEGGVADR